MLTWEGRLRGGHRMEDGSAPRQLACSGLAAGKRYGIEFNRIRIQT
jgi:hypothetical protein